MLTLSQEFVAKFSLVKQALVESDVRKEKKIGVRWFLSMFSAQMSMCQSKLRLRYANFV